MAGKFGVRGGGYSMSNSAAWNIERSWVRDPEPPTRAINMNHLGRVLTATTTVPPIKMLFVYNCNPAVTMPDQNAVLEGLEREDLFTVVFDQVLTDTALYADVVLPATTFLEHYDIRQGVRADHDAARAAGHRSGRRVAVEPGGVCRADSASRTRASPTIPKASSTRMLQILERLPAPHGDELREQWTATPPFERPADSVRGRLPADSERQGASVSGGARSQAPLGLYGFQPDPATADYPLALISPASDRTISSTLGELPRPDVQARHAIRTMPTARGIEDGDDVRMFNELGEVRVQARVTPLVRRGHRVAMPKGVWRRSTRQRLTRRTPSCRTR